MSLDIQIACGQFMTNTGTGNQTPVTGLPFAPKLVGLFSTVGNNDHFLSPNGGWARSATARWCQAAHMYGSPSTGARYFSSTKCFAHVFNALATVIVFIAYDFVSMNSDGFTINQTTASGTAYPINWVALGGADFDAKVGYFDSPTSPGNQTISSIGFQPDVIMIGENSLPSEDNSGATDSALYCEGAGKDASNMWAAGLYSNSGVSTTASNSVLSAVKLWCHTGASNSVVFDGELVSIGSDDFTVHATTVTASLSLRIGYVAMKCPSGVAVGTFAQPISTTGNQVVSGLGITPIGTMFRSAGKTSSNSPSNNAEFMAGAGVSSSQRATIFTSDKNGTSTASSPWQRAISAALSTIFCVDDNTTVLAASDFVSNASGSFTNNWTTCDAVPRVIGYVSLGLAVAPGGATWPGYFHDGAGWQ